MKEKKYFTRPTVRIVDFDSDPLLLEASISGPGSRPVSGEVGAKTTTPSLYSPMELNSEGVPKELAFDF